MKKSLALAALSGFVLVGAAYPDMPNAAGPAAAATAAPTATYRPCRRGDPSDDRCIQLYERGVRTAYARWQRDHGAERVQVAAATPAPPPAPHRHSSADPRCATTEQPGEARGM